MKKTEVLDSVFHPVESRFSGFQVIPDSLSVKLGFRIPIIYEVGGCLVPFITSLTHFFVLSETFSQCYGGLREGWKGGFFE